MQAAEILIRKLTAVICCVYRQANRLHERCRPSISSHSPTVESFWVSLSDPFALLICSIWSLFSRLILSRFSCLVGGWEPFLVTRLQTLASARTKRQVLHIRAPTFFFFSSHSPSTTVRRYARKTPSQSASLSSEAIKLHLSTQHHSSLVF